MPVEFIRSRAEGNHSDDPADQADRAAAPFQPGTLRAGSLSPGEQHTRPKNSERTLASGKSAALADSIGQAPFQEQPVPRIPGYEVLECLGQGSMGTVYRALETKLHRHVALKFIALGPQPKPEEVLRFQIEAESLASVQHSNVVQVYEVGSYENQLFLAMELVSGTTLENYLEQHKLAPRQSAEMALKLARAVQALHQRGIVHRDLKPANVLLDAENEPKLADFGLAKHVETDSRITREGMIVGTPCYMAPEQASGKSRDVGPMADVFSLGVVLYEMLSGRQPFVGETVLTTLQLIRHEEAVPPSRLVGHLPRDLETICLKCLQKDPLRRYATAGELADDLRRFLQGEPVTARPLPNWERGWKWCRRHPALAASGLLLASGLMLGAAGAAWHHAEILTERDATAEYYLLTQEAVETMLIEVAQQPAVAAPHFAERRRVILETALAFYQQLSASHQKTQADPTALAKTHLRQADCLRWLQQYEQAESGYQTALSLLTEAGSSPAQRETIAQPLAAVHSGTGQLHLSTNRLDQAQSSFHSALELNQQLARANPAQGSYLADLAGNHNDLAVCLQGSGKPEQAREHLNIAVELLESLVSRENMHARYVQDLAESHLTLGILLRQLEQHEKVETSYQRALDLFEQLHEEHPRNAHYHAQVSTASAHLGDHYQARGELELAEDHFEQAHAALSGLKEVHGTSEELQARLAHSENRLQRVRSQRQKLNPAE